MNPVSELSNATEPIPRNLCTDLAICFHKSESNGSSYLHGLKQGECLLRRDEPGKHVTENQRKKCQQKSQQECQQTPF